MKTNLRIAAGLALASLLAGCGHSGESNAAMAPPASADAFTQAVQGVVATTSDVSTPIDIDGIAVTAPDNALPVGP